MQMKKKSTMSSVVAAFLLIQLLLPTINIFLSNGSPYEGFCCIESEREALLKFKGDLEDPSKRLATWTTDSDDCCAWAGVICNNLTGHVLELHLRNPKIDDGFFEYETSTLKGKIMNPSLLAIKHLVYMDLSYNDFQGIQIPSFLGSMRNLRYLNLSEARFTGLIPPQLGNLSNLQYLDLNQFFSGGLYVRDLNWISGLALLEHLDLTNVDLSKASSNWLLAINDLPRMIKLKLPSCQLRQFPPFDKYSIPSRVSGLSELVFLDLSFNNFQGPIPTVLQNLTSLEHLDLSFNGFTSSIPNWLYKFNHLKYLSLQYCSLGGKILGDMGNLTHLETLHLSGNFDLQGKIPTSFERLCNLKSIALSTVNLSQDVSEISNIFSICVSIGLESLDLSETQLFGHLSEHFIGQLKNVDTLYLSHNNISGPVPMSLGQLSSLRFLEISYNKLDGAISEIHFTNLTSLEVLEVSENPLTLKVGPDWIPPCQLSSLLMRSCQVGPRFPLWLSSQKFLDTIDISNSRINDKIPIWFWKSSSMVAYLNLSCNQIGGAVPNLDLPIHTLDLSWNNLSGQLPLISSKYLYVLDLSNNGFSGSISHFVCIKEYNTTLILNLENNLLSEELPDCWLNWKTLKLLKIGHNQFTGSIPSSMGALNSLESLHLQRNHLSGTIPLSLQNCSNLGVLDLSENGFTGEVPKWIGKVFHTQILSLHSNKFHGLLPHELCHLSYLQILDLSDNNFSGPVPGCINNLSAMAKVEKFANSYLKYFDGDPVCFAEIALFVMKGRAFRFRANLNLLRIIDLSKNNFSGEIPTGVKYLAALQSLNLSQNSFTGTIPENIGDMRFLESMDFSANQLSGAIPQSLSNLSFLSYLNLSINNLTGEIPSGTQIQGFDPSCFAGNNELCGPPLLPKCPPPKHELHDHDDNENGGGDNNKEGNENEVKGFYVSMALGFVVGFWGVVAPLFFSRRWRHTYFGFLNRLWDKFYITVLRRFY